MSVASLLSLLSLPALVLGAALCALPSCAGPGVSACGAGDPFFNGRDLTGWTNVNGAPSTWTVRDGMIVCSGVPTGVLRTNRMYENFVLELEYKHMQVGGNAGIFVWSDPLTARGQPFTRSVEVQVLDGTETENYTSHGDVFPIHGSSFVPDRPHPNGWMRSLPSERRGKPAGEWNRYVIRCENGNIDVSLNGARVSGGTQSTPRKGYLCLESEGSEVHFRNLSLRELPPADELAPEHVAESDRGFRSLYNGVDLRGWRIGETFETALLADGPSSGGGWTAKDWVLDYDGSGSHLWSEESYRDFELIADWRWSGEATETARPVITSNGQPATIEGEVVTELVQDAGDSGIYLRGSSTSQVNIWCWPIGSGEVYGYRVDEGRSAAVRAGVTPSEKADAPIGQWNRFHITMLGDRLTVVLNGVTVIENAQLPGVAERGPIALQHHGAKIQFANLYVRELN